MSLFIRTFVHVQEGQRGNKIINRLKNYIMSRLDSLIYKYSEMIAELYEYLETMGINPETDEHMIELVNQKNYYVGINMLGD